MNDNQAELSRIIEAVSRDEGMPKSVLTEVIEQSIQAVAKKKYGAEQNIKAQIDNKTGRLSLFRIRTVSEDPKDYMLEISLEDARELNPEAEIGSEIKEALPPVNIDRVGAQAAKQVIDKRIQDIKRERQYKEFKDRKGEILSGVVKKIERGNIIVDINRAEAIILRDQQIIGEKFKIGDNIIAYVQDVRQDTKGPQIFLSRSDDEFLKKLFEREVPEISQGSIEIRAVAREPGSKAKIAVSTNEAGIDPVGPCIGIRGARVNQISNQLLGEKIDVINWDPNLAQFLINSLKPGEISKIVFDESNNHVDAIVPDDQLSIVIGRRGQNVRLASKITGLHIDIITEEKESQKRQEEFSSNTLLLQEKLGVDEVTAQLLSSEGFTDIEGIAYIEDDNLINIGLQPTAVQSIKDSALNYVEERTQDIVVQLEQLGVEQDLLDLLCDIPAEYILRLCHEGIKNVEDLTELSINEFQKIVPNNILPKENAQQILDYASEQGNK